MGGCCSCWPNQSRPEERNSSRSRPIQTSSQSIEEVPLPIQYNLGQTYESPPPPSQYPQHLNRSVSNELSKVAISWFSPIPMSRNQLERKRCEFWETASAYGGTAEIWQTLRQAVEIGDSDIETVRMILQCAGITTPLGSLSEVYDERGFRYLIPNYCICDPSNGVINEDGQDQEETSNLKNYNISTITCSAETSIIVRLSIGKDIRLILPDSSNLCIGHLKWLISKEIGFDGRIEIFWAGHGPLFDDLPISKLNIKNEAHKPIIQAWLFSS